MGSEKIVTTTRDVDAILVPLGTPVTIPKGAQLRIMQELGGSYTVNVNGNLARIEGKDADALGIAADAASTSANGEKKETKTADKVSGPVDERRVWDALKTCYDPEIPVNIVDLGLVYDCRIIDTDEGGRVEIKMTLTAPGCGMAPFIIEDVRQKVLAVPNVVDVHVELVFDPVWDRSMMSDEAKLQLGMF